MLQIIGYLSGLATVFGYAPYIKEILTGTTKPARASWLIWSVLGTIAFASQFSEGARASLWMTGAQTVGVIIIFLLSLRKGEGGLKKRDIAALIVAGLGLILWYFTRQAVWALVFVIIADAAGNVITVMKSYEAPESETLSAWVFDTIGGLLAMIAVGGFSLILLVYPAYIFLANLSVIVAILLGRSRAKEANL